MKFRCLLLLCLLCFAAQAQITDLNKLSKGKFYSYDVIKDESNNIKGYFLLFEVDKVAKETYDLEYVLLDENLTRVTSGIITEMKYESWLASSERVTAQVSLYKDKLLLELGELGVGMVYAGVQPYQRYRILSIANNEVGKPFVYNYDKMTLNPEFDRKMSMTSLRRNTSEKVSFYEGLGMVVNSQNYVKKEGVTKKHLARYSEDFKEIWRYDYSDIKDKKQKELRYLASDKDVMVMFNHYVKSGNQGTYLPDISVMLIDGNQGTLRKEFVFPDLKKYSYRVSDCVIKDNRIYIMGNYAEGNKFSNVDDVKNIGLYKFVLDKTTGELLQSDYFKWESLVGKLDIKKNGFVKKEGQLYTHEMLIKSDGSVLVAAEAFINKPVITNNMYFFEFDSKMGFKDMFVVEKFRNKYTGTNAYSEVIKNYGMFDFIDYQNLGDDEFLFFLNDNEKNSKNRNKSTLYGIVSYADGKFNKQTLNLKTETSKIYALNSKKGYLMLIESFEEKNKPTEFRLEKINY